MFNWFWNFLYSISAMLFQVIDGLFSIANKLCGIEPIQIAGKKSDFMVFLLTNEKITYGFAGAVLISIFLLMMFGTIAICRACANGKKTPGQVVIHIVKTLLVYLFVPALMITFTILVNNLVAILYKATLVGGDSMGGFLFRSFLPDDMQSETFDIDWKDVSAVRSLMSTYGYGLSKYKFFFSWLVCLPLVVVFAKSIFVFVERCLSIVILYIISPIVMSSTVLDEGARFKQWRDEILGKFLGGFGMIIGINIYILVLSIVIQGDVRFFDNNFSNFLFKMVFCIGGAFFLTKIFQLIGSLIGKGSGADFQSSGAFAGAAGSAAQWVYKKAKGDDKDKDKEKDQDKKEAAKKAAGGGGDSTKGGLGLNSGGGLNTGGSNHNDLNGMGKQGDNGGKVKDAIRGLGGPAFEPGVKSNSGGDENRGGADKGNAMVGKPNQGNANNNLREAVKGAISNKNSNNNSN